ncbi:MAG TPA: hypothetical protein VK846_12375 [Candidatus Limnocylindria bacterium]|nr:hypothetical protein [Candidatus Limnocylindria bacterium]
MKAKIFSAAAGALVLAGCATSDERHYTSDHPRTGDVYVDPQGDRIYVREYDRDDRRGSPYFQNNMEPRVRGKHADSLGWNDENYYLQRGYKR